MLGNTFAFTQNLMERTLTHNVAKGGLSEKSSRMMGIFHVGNGNSGVGDAIVDHSIDGNSYAVFG